jgi:hypothetical protein
MRDNNCDDEGEPLHTTRDATSALARQLYRDFNYSEPSINIGNDILVHVFGEYLDVAIVGGDAQMVATAESEIRERYFAITAMTDNVDVVFTTRAGEGMLELPFVSYY